LELFFNKKSHGSGLWITWPRLALGPWWTHEHGAALPLQGSRGRRDSSEREREEVIGVLTMMPLEDGAVEMVIRRCSTEADGVALMGRWFRACGGEIGIEVGADNGGALVATFISP
jgi:hypothetical protein